MIIIAIICDVCFSKYENTTVWSIMIQIPKFREMFREIRSKGIIVHQHWYMNMQHSLILSQCSAIRKMKLAFVSCRDNLASRLPKWLLLAVSAMDCLWSYSVHTSVWFAITKGSATFDLSLGFAEPSDMSEIKPVMFTIRAWNDNWWRNKSQCVYVKLKLACHAFRLRWRTISNMIH